MFLFIILYITYVVKLFCMLKIQKHTKSTRLKFFVYIKRNELAPTKHNIFRRDANTCQYCGSKKDLTIDHVVPVSKGGKNTWTNMVTACHKCNNKKGDKSLEDIGFTLKSTPRKPGFFNIFHDYYKENSLESWKDYIFIN